jgi:hypothetical protein
MNPVGSGVLVAVLVFAGTITCTHIGFRIARRRAAGQFEGLGTIEAAVFALLGLLLGFSFSDGLTRLEARRNQIVHETDAIGTAYLRLDTLPPSDQPALRSLFREYLDARLRAYALTDNDAIDAEIRKAEQIQKRIWSAAVAASGSPEAHPSTRVVLLPAVNELIDATTDRKVAIRSKLPGLIFVLLVLTTLLSGLFAGFAMAKREALSRLHVLVYALVTAATIYTIVDLEYPRAGIIRLEAADSAIRELHNSIR